MIVLPLRMVVTFMIVVVSLMVVAMPFMRMIVSGRFLHRFVRALFWRDAVAEFLNRSLDCFEVLLAIEVDGHGARRCGNRDVIDARKFADGGVDLRGTVCAIHAVDAVALFT